MRAELEYYALLDKGAPPILIENESFRLLALLLTSAGFGPLRIQYDQSTHRRDMVLIQTETAEQGTELLEMVVNAGYDGPTLQTKGKQNSVAINNLDLLKELAYERHQNRITCYYRFDVGEIQLSC